MKFLLDVQAERLLLRMDQHPKLVAGQLVTPLTAFKNWGGSFAIDNGAYTGLDRDAWFRLLSRSERFLGNCLFCVAPDIVGNALRTDELFSRITQDPRCRRYSKCWALVAQDGHENRPIAWEEFRCLFVGGTDRFKDSSAAYDLVKTAKALGKHVHVGRVNTARRYRRFAELGADTCDGSGVCRYDHMLDEIAADLRSEPEPDLFGLATLSA